MMTAARRHGKRVGYIRVSTVEQNVGRQLEGVQIDKKFADRVSGKDTNRPQLQAALDYVRDGDVLVAHSMDRLARNLTDLRRLVTELTAKGVAVEFTKENLTFTGDDNAMSNLLLNVMGAFAEFERALLLERQREGIAIAKAEGKYKGRKRTLTTQQVMDLRTRAASGEMSKTALAEEFGISRETLYQYLRAGNALQTA
jgi:DNA invertase Pin-like site-specific DNA recombinase